MGLCAAANKKRKGTNETGEPHRDWKSYRWKHWQDGLSNKTLPRGLLLNWTPGVPVKVITDRLRPIRRSTGASFVSLYQRIGTDGVHYHYELKEARGCGVSVGFL